ncbi:MAG: VWA domain-containing protein [Lachnospiraceae bacterium]|nr:VWA domain-containing protein [Lachnospiraceae bacterium]
MAYDNRENGYFTSEYYDQYDSTISNGEARIPICFCIDTSESMRFITNEACDYTIIEGSDHVTDGVGSVSVEFKPGVQRHYRIDEVKRVLKKMLGRIRNDRRMANAAVISIVTFDEYADCIIEFSEINRIYDSKIDQIKTDKDKTNASRGISMALERLDRFRKDNNDAGNESYKPVLVFMSDGDVMEDKNAGSAIKEVRDRSEAGRLNVIPIAIGGKDAKKDWLRRLSKDAYVYNMEHEKDFDNVFDIITRKIERAAMVIPVDEDLASVDTKDPGTVNMQEPDETSTEYGADVSGDDLAWLKDFINS